MTMYLNAVGVRLLFRVCNEAKKRTNAAHIQFFALLSNEVRRVRLHPLSLRGHKESRLNKSDIARVIDRRQFIILIKQEHMRGRQKKVACFRIGKDLKTEKEAVDLNDAGPVKQLMEQTFLVQYVSDGIPS